MEEKNTQNLEENQLTDEEMNKVNGGKLVLGSVYEGKEWICEKCKITWMAQEKTKCKICKSIAAVRENNII